MDEKKKKAKDIAGVEEKSLALHKPEDFTIKRRLTMDATSIGRLGQVICQCTGELEQIDMPANGANGQPTKAWAVPIVDVVRGEEFLLIANSLIVSALRRVDGPLAGHYFAMRAGEIKAGKRYRHVDIVHLELVS